MTYVGRGNVTVQAWGIFQTGVNTIGEKCKPLIDQDLTISPLPIENVSINCHYLT
jgi:hypothetical protein